MPANPYIAFTELLAYTAGENERWHRWFAAHGEALDVPFGDPPLATARDVVHHVAFIEQRYSAILAGRPVPPPPAIAPEVDALFAYLAECRRGFEAAIEGATNGGLDRMIDFTTLTAGPQRRSARTIIAHALNHGVRHWAQLATVLRAHGHRTDWSHDLLLSGAVA